MDPDTSNKYKQEIQLSNPVNDFFTWNLSKSTGGLCLYGSVEFLPDKTKLILTKIGQAVMPT